MGVKFYVSLREEWRLRVIKVLRMIFGSERERERL
jgi:hypothetical protein